MEDNIDNSMRAEGSGHIQTVNIADPVAPMRIIPILMALIVVSLIALVMAVTSIIYENIKYKILWDQYQLVENENRMNEMYTMELDAKLVGKGILKEDETYISLRPKLSKKVEKK